MIEPTQNGDAFPADGSDPAASGGSKTWDRVVIGWLLATWGMFAVAALCMAVSTSFPGTWVSGHCGNPQGDHWIYLACYALAAAAVSTMVGSAFAFGSRWFFAVTITLIPISLVLLFLTLASEYNDGCNPTGGF